MARIFAQIDVIVAANGLNADVIFTSSDKIPRTLIKVWSIHKTAANDLLVYDEQELIADVPCDMLPATDDKLVFDRKIKPGHTVAVGFREGAGAGHTAAIVVESEIPDKT